MAKARRVRDYKDNDIDLHVRQEINRHLGLWSGSREIQDIYQKFSELSQDKLFIREVLQEAKRNFYYYSDVDKVTSGGIEVEVEQVEWEVDVDRDELFPQIPSLDDEFLEKILDRDGVDWNKLSKDEKENYKTEAEDLDSDAMGEIEDKTYDYDTEEVFKPIEEAFVTVLERKLNPRKEKAKSSDIAFFVQECIIAGNSEVAYDSSEYAGCVIKMINAGYERAFLSDFKDLVAKNHAAIFDVIYRDLNTTPEYAELKAEYAARRVGKKDAMQSQHRALIAVSRIIAEDVKKTLAKIHDDFERDKFKSTSVIHLDLSEGGKTWVENKPAEPFIPAEYHAPPDVMDHIAAVEVYHKTFPADTGPERLVYPSRNPLNQSSIDIRPLLAGAREQGRKVQEVIEEETSKVQKQKFDDDWVKFRAGIEKIKEEGELYAADNRSWFRSEEPHENNSQIFKLRKKIESSPQYKAAEKIRKAISAVGWWVDSDFLDVDDGGKPDKVLENLDGLPALLRAVKHPRKELGEIMTTTREDLDDKAKRVALKAKLKSVQKAINGKDLLDAPNALREMAEAAQNISESPAHHQDFKLASERFFGLKIQNLSKAPEYKELKKMSDSVKVRPPTNFTPKNTTNVIYPVFLFCVSSSPPRFGIKGKRVFVPVGLNIDGKPFLISGDPEDGVFTADIEAKIGAAIGTLPSRAVHYAESEAAKVRSAAREDRSFAAGRAPNAGAGKDMSAVHASEGMLLKSDDELPERLSLITGHSERVLSRAMRDPKVIAGLVADLRKAVEANIEKFNFTGAGPLKVYSATMLLYSKRTVCPNCTRTTINSMHDWNDGAGVGEAGFMKLLADELNRVKPGEQGFIAYEPTDHDGKRSKSRNGLRGNAVVIADELYAQGDEHGKDVRAHPETRIAHTANVDVKSYSKRRTFIEVLGITREEEVTPHYVHSNPFMSGSALGDLGTVNKKTNELSADAAASRAGMDYKVARYVVVPVKRPALAATSLLSPAGSAVMPDSTAPVDSMASTGVGAASVVAMPRVETPAFSAPVGAGCTVDGKPVTSYTAKLAADKAAGSSAPPQSM